MRIEDLMDRVHEWAAGNSMVSRFQNDHYRMDSMYPKDTLWNGEVPCYPVEIIEKENKLILKRKTQ